MTDNTMREALKAMFKAGFIEAAQWGSPSSQDVDSPALNAAMAERVEPTITALEWQSQQAQGESQSRTIEKLSKSVEIQKSQIENLTTRVNLAEEYQACRSGDETASVWFWQGDGEDHPESLANSVPVVIRADMLRSLIQPPAPAAVPESRDFSNSDEAREFLVSVCKPEYRRYISNGQKLAGDFACHIAAMLAAAPAPAEPDRDEDQAALFRGRNGAED